MKTRQLLLALAAVLCQTAWSAAAAPIAQRDVDQIQPGRTTETDLLRMFGPPTTQLVDIRGKKTLDWMESTAAPPQAYLPIIGPFLGAFDVQVQQLSVLVGANGRVERYIMNDSKAKLRMRNQRELAWSGK